jgi:hypothetical protein
MFCLPVVNLPPQLTSPQVTSKSLLKPGKACCRAVGEGYVYQRFVGICSLSKVSSREILNFEDLLASLIIVFLSFLRYSFFNSGFSIFEIRVINKSSCSSALVQTEQVFVLLQQESKHPILTSLENSLAE